MKSLTSSLPLGDIQLALAIVYRLCHFFAVTVMVFLRRRLGYRTVTLPIMIISCFVLWSLGWLALIFSLIGRAVGRGGTDVWVLLFAVVVFVLSQMQRRSRWKEMQQGQLWFSYSRGTSRLTGIIPVPQQLLEGLLEPLICIVAGIIVLLAISVVLGVWLIFAGVCLAICEAITVDQIRMQLLDTMDSLLVASVQRQNVQFFSGAAAMNAADEQAKEAETPEEAGLPTDHQSDDIQRKIERRRKRLEDQSRPANP